MEWTAPPMIAYDALYYQDWFVRFRVYRTKAGREVGRWIVVDHRGSTYTFNGARRHSSKEAALDMARALAYDRLARVS